MATGITREGLGRRLTEEDGVTDGPGHVGHEDFADGGCGAAQPFVRPVGRGAEPFGGHVFDGLFTHLTQEAGADESPAGGRFLEVTGELLYQSGEAHFARVLRPVLTKVISLCGENTDGRIAAEEFRAWLTGIGVAPVEARNVVRGAVNGGGGGPLSVEELLAAVRAYHFGRLDVELLGRAAGAPGPTVSAAPATASG
jgi:hypothetical protein